MIIQFKDRKKELQELGDVISAEKFQMLIIYGRRRVGKTELILNASKTQKRVYYLATAENNLDRFYNTCVSFDKEAAKLKKDWETLFEFLKDKAEVVIIDEFQNIISEDKNILNIFQSIVDVTLKESKVKLFLVGSSVSMMTSRVLSYKSPLYGRRSGSINLKPVSFFDLADFFPHADIGQLMKIYGFADGIPFYLIRIDREFRDWLKNELRQEKSFLRDEVDFLVRYEFTDAGTYKLILEAIAKGNTKLNEIKNFIEYKRTDITPYLKNLMEVGFVKRIVPITENVKSRKGRYLISDNFLKFWFRYIYPNLSSIEEGIFSEEVIRKDYNSYLGLVFEDVCRQFITKIPLNFAFTKIGKWWHGDNEIDIVGLDENSGGIFFAECKWKDNVNPRVVLAELKEKAKYVGWRNNKRSETYCIIAKSFTERINDCLLFDAHDIEKVLRRR